MSPHLQVCGGLQPSHLHAQGRRAGLGGEGLPGAAGTLPGRHRGGTGVPWEGRECRGDQRAPPGWLQEEEEEQKGGQEARPAGQQGKQAGALMGCFRRLKGLLVILVYRASSSSQI